jgi:hypothetical protein
MRIYSTASIAENLMLSAFVQLSFNRSYFSWAVAVHILSLNQGYENLAK